MNKDGRVSFVKLPEVTVTLFSNRLVCSDLFTLSKSPVCSMLQSRNAQKTRHVGEANVSRGESQLRITAKFNMLILWKFVLVM